MPAKKKITQTKVISAIGTSQLEALLNDVLRNLCSEQGATNIELTMPESRSGNYTVIISYTIEE